MSRAAFQTSPLISFSHIPRGTRSYITAFLALRSRQQATNHTKVNIHMACLRQSGCSTISPSTTVVLVMNKCHGNGTFGFGFLNWAFFQTRHSTMMPWSDVGFWSRKRSVWKIEVLEQFFFFFLATQWAITTPISSGTGVRSGSSCQCIALHSSHTVFYLLIYFFWKDHWDIWQVFSSFSITEFSRMAPPTCSRCEPVDRTIFCLVRGGVGLQLAKSCYITVHNVDRPEWSLAKEGERRSPCALLLCLAVTQMLTAEMMEYSFFIGQVHRREYCLFRVIGIATVTQWPSFNPHTLPRTAIKTL